MKRIFGSLSRRSSPSLNTPSEYPDDSPEGTILKAVKAFCETGGQDNRQGTEFVHLPAIVENAESSPNAAREAAQRLRKYLSDPASTPAYIQYNAIMLMRILIDNPGHTFTRNIDAKFVATIKDLLRDGWDLNVQHFLRETLGAIESQRQWDEDLAPLMHMWKKEKGKLSRQNSGSTWRSSRSQQQQQQQQAYTYMQSSARPASSLPPPDELAARVTEAKTSAKLLLQFVQSTTPAEFNENELIKEFCTRCQTASRAIQNYIHSTNPAPDENTLQTLIETNDELSVALSKYQHAFLSARKATGNSGSQSPVSSNEATVSGINRPLPALPVPRGQVQSPSPSVSAPTPQPQQQQNTATAATLTAAPVNNGTARYEYRSEDFQVQNPFADAYSTPNNALGATENQQPAGSHQRPTQQTL
ncbi:VHS and GAT domain-containing protein [Aspergillus thermomutatus]|uniref:GAT domain-containing protein n=1 Tax=Aspergillus thermomutatus TaxID=41047 RepID=A0A397HGX4_ASPTH|nr:uncharacterized protein CDV56_108574 [Aspergillus thermomutatus]RHZ62312.1 hypothetical protein CDV56_108574 [Aspergillus thermomutatus]